MFRAVVQRVRGDGAQHRDQPVDGVVGEMRIAGVALHPLDQEISVEVDESLAVDMPLRPGEASLHNGRLAHASGPNRSADRRIGLSLHYAPTSTKQVVGDWDSAALVRGEDHFGHFAHTPRITRDFEPAAVEFHQRATTAVRDVLFAGAEKVRKTL